MKKIFLLVSILFTCIFAYSQWSASGTDIFNNNAGNVGIGTNTPATKLSVINNTTSGMTTGISGIQTKVNTTDNGDGTLSVTHNLSVLSSASQFVTRAFSLGAFNNLTGGGTISYMRSLNIANSTSLGTKTDNLDAIYLENATSSGIVNNSRGIRMNNFQGINQAGLAINMMGGDNHTYALLGSVEIPVGYYGVYSAQEQDNNFFAGNVGVGTATPQAKLDVNGNIFCNNKIYVGEVDASTISQIADYALAVNGTAVFSSVKVKFYGNWPDYVFKNSYKPMTLQKVEEFLKQNKHLPGVPSAEEVKRDGINLAENQSILLKKVEELTLYLIDQNKKISEQQVEISILKDQIKDLKKKDN